jgi:hypothetical protein
MKTVIIKNGITEFERFEDQPIEKHPSVIRDAVLHGLATYTDSYGAEWTATRNDGPQKYAIQRAGERVIATHHPDGSVTHMARFVAPGNSFAGGGWLAIEQIEKSYTAEERKLLGK